MGGFQKYPFPKSSTNIAWVHNRRWFGHSVFACFSSLMIWLSLERFIVANTKYHPGVGSFIDPKEEMAPKEIKF